MTLIEMHSPRIHPFPPYPTHKSVKLFCIEFFGHFFSVIWIKLKEIFQLHFVIINRKMNIFSLTFLYTPTTYIQHIHSVLWCFAIMVSCAYYFFLANRIDIIDHQPQNEMHFKSQRKLKCVCLKSCRLHSNYSISTLLKTCKNWTNIMNLTK